MTFRESSARYWVGMNLDNETKKRVPYDAEVVSIFFQEAYFSYVHIEMKALNITLYMKKFCYLLFMLDNEFNNL